jgi:hypothetical protein
MPNTAIEKQSSFSAGEVSPETYGRTDIASYKQGLKLARNFIVTKHGAIKNRPGTRLVAACKNTGSSIPPRLIPFVFSDGQTFVLEVGDRYFRLHQNGAPVYQGAGAGASWDIATAYPQYALVSVANVSYIAISANTGNAPASSPASWQALDTIGWIPSGVYSIGRFEFFGLGIYKSLSNGNTGNSPASSPSSWTLVNSFGLVEVVTPWSIADVMRLKYAQSGDVITVCHPSYPPQDIQRISNSNWTVVPSLLSPPAWPWPAITSPSIPIQPDGAVLGNGITSPIAPYSPFQNLYPAGSVVSYTDTYTPGAQRMTYFAVNPVHQGLGFGTQLPTGNTGPLAAPSLNWVLFTWSATYPYQLNQYAYAQNLTVGGTPNLAGVIYESLQPSTNQYPNATIGSYWQLSGDASTHPATPITYAITMSLKALSGITIESLPAFFTPPGGAFPRFIDRPIALQFNQPFTPSKSITIAGVAYIITGINIYAGRNGVYGLVDSMDASQVAVPNAVFPPFFVDQGAAIDFNIQPPAGTNPFAVPDGAGGTTYSYPGAVAYFQQRRLFGRSSAKPNGLWGSAVGNFQDFDRPNFVIDSDSFEFEIAATKLEEIRSIVPQRELLIFTSSSETVASGSNGGVGGAITPTSIDIRPASHHGASYLDPIVADHSVLDVTAKGCYIRDLQYDWRSASYTGRDITSLVRHLLDGHTIVDWFYAETPDNMIWIVRDDGNLLSLTYEQDFQVVAFAQHSSNQALLGATQGLFQRVCSVPEGTEDAAYFVVQRSVNGALAFVIERLSSRVIAGPNGSTDYRQACFFDCALVFNGRNTAAPNDSILSVAIDTPAAGQFTLTLNNTFPFTANDAALNNLVVIHPDGVATPGTDDQPGKRLQAASLRIVTFTATNQLVCEMDTAPPPNWGLYSNTSDWAIARGTFTGLVALEGNAVGALVDGNADLGRAGDIVTGGTITLTKPGVDVIVGLPYFSDLQTLDTEADAYKVNQRQVQQASIEVVNSRGFSVGESFGPKMNALKPRSVADGYGLSPLLSGIQGLSMANSWNTSGSICLRMKDPLPLTIVSIIREIAVGGKG